MIYIKKKKKLVLVNLHKMKWDEVYLWYAIYNVMNNNDYITVIKILLKKVDNNIGENLFA